MFQRRVPEDLRHAPVPSVRGFAMLAGIEAAARGILISVFPLVMYRALGDAGVVSAVYFAIGVVSLAVGLLVPWLTRLIPRRWTYTIGVLLYVLGAVLAIAGGPVLTVLALMSNTFATVTVFVCFNAYVLDYVSRVELGRSETLRLFYSALSWMVGPVAGVWLLQHWEPAPFIVSAIAALCLLTAFWVMRLGNGKLIVRARKPAANPLAYLRRFFSQRRLIAGWLFAVLRSCGWWVYVVYLPIYAVENGLGEDLGGIALSITNGCLFLTPLMLRWIRRHSVRHAVRVGFLTSGTLFAAAAIGLLQPWQAVALLMMASVFLVLLDICGGLPFLMAVKPSERTEMSAVYSSFRDVSSILTPGAAWLVLLVAPLSMIFAATGFGLLVAWGVARRLHPRLGTERSTVGMTPVPHTPLTIETPAP